MSGTIKIGSRNYTWAELSKPDVRRTVLPQVEAMIAAYKKNPEPWHAQGYNALDVKVAIMWTGGAFDNLPAETMGAYMDEAIASYNAEISKLGGEPLPMATTLTAGTQPPVIDGRTAFKELTQWMKNKEVVTALQRRRVGQSIDERQTALLAHHDALSAANNSQARAERAQKVTKPPRASIEAPIVAPKFKDVDEARGKRLELQHDLGSDYHNPASAGYKQARETVKAAYQLETGEAQTK